MKAFVLRQLTDLALDPEPLSWETVPDPEPGTGEVLIRVSVCGVCHTELDEIEGRTSPPALPVIPGHQVVGRVVEVGPAAPREELPGSPNGKAPGAPPVAAPVAEPKVGDRVGVAWIYAACGRCEWCLAGLENLCPGFTATGRDADGGYAEYMTVPAAYAHPVPEGLTDAEAAPLLCAGAIGYRSLRLADVPEGGRLGLTGFGASGHLMMMLVRAASPGTEVFVFARSPEQREHALELGAAWAGATEDTPPAPLHAIIDTTPAWKPVVSALENIAPGGRLVINAIRKEDGDRDLLAEIDYPRHLWMEKEIKSVANVTRRDVRELLAQAARSGVRPRVQAYPLADANRALVELKGGGGMGAKVLRVTE